MNYDSQTQIEAQLKSQPVLPSISLRYYMLAIVFFSILNAVVFLFGSIKLQVLFGFMLGAIVLFLLFVGACFVFAFLVGALKSVFFEPTVRTESPFATEAMPPQIIPRQARD